ncbi:MAG: histidine kinase [Ferruginibacter sp.]
MDKKLLSLLFFWLGISFCAYAQLAAQKTIDSVRAIAFKKDADTNAVNAFSELQRYYFNLGKYDSALFYSRRSLPVAEKSGTAVQYARILYNAGMIYTNLTRYDSAIYYLTEAEKRAWQVADTNLHINILNAQGLLSNYRSDYKGAIEFFTRAAAFIEKTSNPAYSNMLQQLYGNIGHNLIAEKQLLKGIAYEQKALQIPGTPDVYRHRVMMYLDIADAYMRLQQPADARRYLDTAKTLEAKLSNSVIKIMVLNSDGLYYAGTKEYAASLQAYLQAYAIADSTGNTYMKAECGDNVARAYLKIKDYTHAAQYAQNANAIAAGLQNHSLRAGSYETLKNVAAAQNDFAGAFRYAELYKLYADSASNEATQQSTLYLEARYQNVKKENEIAALTISNKNKELEVFRRNKILLTGGIVSAALLLLMGLLYRQSRHKRIIAEKDAMLQQEQVKFLERQQQLVSLQAMVNGQETERTRIAKDLHDGLGGLFSTTKMYFSTLQHEQPALKEEPLFIKSYEMVNAASEEVRRIAHNMMPEVLIKIGLLQATQELCNSVSAGKLLTVTLQSYGMEQRLGSSTEIMLFRIIQELLNNIIRHAKATEALIQFNREGDRLSIIVEDNGHGFNTAAADGKAKAGLASVESRVHYLNGTLSIDSQQNSGTTVMMDFLLSDAS